MIRLPLVLLILVVAGCCVAPPAVDRYFNRSTPIGTTNYFRYALESKQYAGAYDCLSGVDRERFSLTKFRLAAMFAKHPQYGLHMREYIIGCQPIDERFPERSRAVVETFYDAPGLFTEEELHLKLEEDEWLIDFEATLMNFQQ